MKVKATDAQKQYGICLWNSIVDEVYLIDEFNLCNDLKCKSELLLLELKKKVWRISLQKGTTEDAMIHVFEYNKMVNDLLSIKFDQSGMFQPNEVLL